MGRLEAGDPQAALASADLFFHDHADLVHGLAEALAGAGLVEACQALARHLEEDREHWLRRLERVEAEPALRARRMMAGISYVDVDLLRVSAS